MKNQESLIISIVLGCLVMFSLILIIILFIVKYQRKMLLKEKQIKQIEQEKQVQLFKAIVDAEEKQKERIAHNLHDTINPMLGLLKLNLSKHKIDFSKDKFNVDDFKKDASIIDEITENIRLISKELTSSYINNQGLIGSIERYVSIIAESKTLTVKFNNKINDCDFKLNRNDQANTFRIFLELINNILKHAQCTVIEINLKLLNNAINIRINHNGKGIDNEDVKNLVSLNNGIGLKSIKSRVVMLNAKLDYKKNINNSSVNLSVPLT